MDTAAIDRRAAALVRIGQGPESNSGFAFDPLSSPLERIADGRNSEIDMKGGLNVNMDNSNSTNSPVTTGHKTSLMGLPNEILIDIFYMVSYNERKCRAVAFGLINTRMYSILKDAFPGPIFDRDGFGIMAPSSSMPHISHVSENVIWRWEMQYIIGNFLGPAYRLRNYDNRWLQCDGSDTPFVNRSIYGDDYGNKEQDLNERWYDYKNNTNWRKALPCPFGMGEEWYAETIDWIREQRVSIYSDRFSKAPLHVCLKYTYEKIMAMHGTIWDAFAEWRDLVDF